MELLFGVDVGRVAARIARRARASQNRGTLSPAETARILSWIKGCAEEAAGRALTTADLEEGLGLGNGDGSYIRQYLKVKGARAAGTSGMSFKSCDRSLSMANFNGWFRGEKRTRQLAAVKARLAEAELAQNVVQRWKRAKRKSVGLQTALADLAATAATLQSEKEARALPEALAIMDQISRKLNG